MNSKIEDLKKENSELQQSLEEHHEMLELIMSKYKQQSHKLSVTTNLEGTKPPCNYTKVRSSISFYLFVIVQHKN